MQGRDVSGIVIGAAIDVHSALGPGLLESAYEACLAWELVDRGLSVRQQVPQPIVYKSVRLDVAYRIDLIVDEHLIIEVKAVSRLIPIHEVQVLSYLRLSGHKIGLVINFHERHLKDGIRRIVNNW